MPILEKLGRAMMRGGEKLENLNKAYVETIWELDGVPAFKQFWTEGLTPWRAVYRGYYEPWHMIAEPTIANPTQKRKMYRLNAAKFVCATLAKYVWGERCKVSVSSSGGAENDLLQAFIDYVLEVNGFYTKLGEQYEKAAAFGGACLKCWAEVGEENAPEFTRLTRDVENEDGDNEKAVCRLPFSYHNADQFIPTEWTNAKVTGGIFVSRELKKGYYYTRIERHAWKNGQYEIYNSLYRISEDDAKRTAGVRDVEPQNILGYSYPLNDVYPTLSPYTVVENIDQSLFSYFRPAGANNLDDNSPLGMSIYGNALDTLRAIDEAYDGFCTEVRLSRKRIIVPARATKTMTVTGTNGSSQQVRYFDANDPVYEALNFENAEDLKIVDNTLDMRVDSCVAAINAQLSILAVQIGFDAGIFAFDKATGLKTATEVVSENSKTYGTVVAHQNILKDAITKFVNDIINVAVGYGVEFDGQSVESLVGKGYEVSIAFDDSIVQDKAAETQQGILEVNSQLMSRKRYLTQVKGMTDADAEAEIDAIKKEQSVDAEAVETFGAE